MRKNPNLINSVEVKYFRSINSQRIRECKPVNIITGSNDIGKSNLLRALNLFFNEKDEHGADIVFRDEFSHSRLDAVRRESVKGRQFIQIEVEFNCQDSFQKTLPPRFKVRKTWYRDSKTPNLSHDLERHLAQGSLQTTKNKAEGSLQRFLNSIVFTYLPAIKDRSIFQAVLSDLQSVLFESSSGGFANDIERFSGELEGQAQELRQAFFDITGVDARISLPSTYAELFRAFNIKTSGSFEESVSLDNRGDGVRVRFLPAILNYIAERSPKLHVWGIEEPENSMEYKRAFELANAMTSSYCQNAQIFLTTHSPAFIDLTREGQSIYMAKREGGDTIFTHLNSAKKQKVSQEDPEMLIADELGHIKLMNDLHEKLQARLAAAEEAERHLAAAMEEVNKLNRPVLLTEGKTDVLILIEAWKKLRGGTPPFEIKSCNVLGEQEKTDAAGAAQLAMCLRSIMADHQHSVIGLFDRDIDGIKGWNLDANFGRFETYDDVKVSKNKKAYAIRLPVPAKVPDLEKSSHHCVEFMFPIDALKKTVEDKGLRLRGLPVETRCGNTVITTIQGTEIWQMIVDDGKKWFAEKVVPTLPVEDFEAFEQVFSLIDAILTPKVEPEQQATETAVEVGTEEIFA
ncbi:putative AbiEii toxin of type IV toxin-antitoxin system [Neorhizobium sp. R1-B]|uniref:ATP-dependent nuclease n=1 Tax=Neorhizobium sp. R1-B TaxID=2485162 RepID=UPI00106501BB|nr:ATP-binding protein [Neorhizobium sp. R1-B]TDX76221.1 putative AbiEii toxin of type IV toxin-antitoxin system [Neorhizobium sp. R1-B]